MNIRLITPFLALLVALPASAQTPPNVAIPTQFQRDANTVLTPAFVRDTDFIGIGRLSQDRNDATIARLGVSMMGEEPIRGWHFMAGRGLVLPTAERGAPLSRDPALVFGRYDPISQKVVLLARLDATPENIAKAKELEAANRRLKVTFSSDKTTYGTGEPIVLKWEVENTSTTPQKFYTGQYALQYETVYDNRAHSTGTGGTHTRKTEDYVELAPGQKWSQTRTVAGPFPQGTVSIEMTLDSSDNFLGSDLSEAKLEERQARERVLGVVLLRETGAFSVEIKAPDAQTQTALVQKLSSLDWNEAYAAAQTLAQLDSAAAMPEVKRLSRHSWPAMRILAAQALSKNATTLTPELRALLFDPNARVRNETLEDIRRHSIGGAGLSMLAMQAVNNEAADKKITEKKPTHSLETALSRTRDGDRDLGDLLAARIENGQATADGINAPYLLNFISENFHTTRVDLGKPATPEQTAAIIAAWKGATADLKGTAKQRTEADLDAEIKEARTAMYGDFKVGPHFPEVVLHLQNLYGQFFPRPDNPDRQWFENLDADSRVDVLHALQWETGRTLDSLDNAPAWRAIAQLDGPAKNEAFRFLLARLYNAQTSTNTFYETSNIGYFAPIALAKLDFEHARPHLQTALRASQVRIQLGAAVGLLVGGDKSALPLVFETTRWNAINSVDLEELDAALAKTTGLQFKNHMEWKKWWDETGHTQAWK